MSDPVVKAIIQEALERLQSVGMKFSGQYIETHQIDDRGYVVTLTVTRNGRPY